MIREPFHHVRSGRGEPLVLLHGVAHHLQGWAPVIDLLGAGLEVIAVDSPGFGRSEPLPVGVEPTIDHYADAFAGFLVQQGLERPHVAGNSMGGAIALELGRRGLVSSVTAISPAGFWTPGERRFCQRSLGITGALPPALRPAVSALAGTAAGRTMLFGQYFSRPWRTPAAEAQAVLADAWASPILDAALQAFDHYTFANGEELAGVPVTVAWGSRDLLLPYWRQAPRARALLPSARHVTLPGLGHTPYYDDPGMVAAVVRRGTGIDERLTAATRPTAGTAPGT